MRRPSVRADFSQARFLAGARFIANTRGVAEVTYTSVALLCQTTVSAVQRQFGSAAALRAGAIEAWRHGLERVRGFRPRAGAVGVFDLVAAWLLSHCASPLPFDLLRPTPERRATPEWEGLRAIVMGATSEWRIRLERQVGAVARAEWRPDVDLTILSHGLFAAGLSVAPAEAALGPVAAVRAVAVTTAALLQTATGRELAPQSEVDGVVRRAEAFLRLRPQLAAIDEEHAIAVQSKPRRRSGESSSAVAQSPPEADWDDFLAQATAELAEYRRSHPDEDDEAA